MKKEIWKVSDLVEIGYPRTFILNCCNSIYGNRFARKTGPNGIWLIRKKKFEEMIDQGYFDSRQD